MDLAPGELLTSIRVPRRFADWRHFYRKVGTRRAQAISKVCFAGIRRGDEMRIALGSVAPIPIFLEGPDLSTITPHRRHPIDRNLPPASSKSNGRILEDRSPTFPLPNDNAPKKPPNPNRRHPPTRRNSNRKRRDPKNPALRFRRHRRNRRKQSCPAWSTRTSTSTSPAAPTGKASKPPPEPPPQVESPR